MTNHHHDAGRARFWTRSAPGTRFGRAGGHGCGPDYLPARRRWMRVFFRSLRCFFFAMRLRRFLMTEPTYSPLGIRSDHRTRHTLWSGRPRRSAKHRILPVGHPAGESSASGGNPTPERRHAAETADGCDRASGSSRSGHFAHRWAGRCQRSDPSRHRAPGTGHRTPDTGQNPTPVRNARRNARRVAVLMSDFPRGGRGASPSGSGARTQAWAGRCGRKEPERSGGGARAQGWPGVRAWEPKRSGGGARAEGGPGVAKDRPVAKRQGAPEQGGGASPAARPTGHGDQDGSASPAARPTPLVGGPTCPGGPAWRCGRGRLPWR